ncbi:4Fe-4S ferredoxin iron-sulfur binding domain protein [Methylocella silvestris BL2]|uniref:4Fe-4S ferredoxin iron-sulfur binding domain protein n=1 Tax=Methylocella silvestris (strain DSM 15510 / CIP 108128 / LMG 27833 / NCIMB 13906 / BL2) TaxID=395965 RepID=B8EIT0_METSB|nr:NAD(P)-binding protein [Methylocella silvestris]ACK51897.1 4Fe-4S ferredoxin iron-sulfur binding domain protein [Methylocella silvestris BL2]
MTALKSDFTPVVDLLHEKGAGPVRTRQPHYVDLMPPCNNACPAGENVQAWLDLAQAGKYRDAWETILRENPFPAVHGRVCYHPCETGCNRAQLDSAVSIHAVERFLGDLATAQGWTLPVTAAPTGKRILVVGGGPSGLSASYHLTRLGHEVEIREAGPLPGGMLHFGIPAYRLPRDVLMTEIRRIESMGVRITLNHKVEDVLAEQAEGKFHAVFIAIGAQIGKRIDIPARDAARVIDAITLLHQVETGEPPRLGRRVVIYGGGNTAMDAARTARRLGAEEAIILYHRDRAHMGAQAFETDEALSEGIKIKWLSTIKDIGEGELTVEVMQMDEQGHLQPSGRLETLSADSVVLALGQQTDSGFLRNVPGVAFLAGGTVKVDDAMMTGRPGLFAGGDMVPSERTVTAAVGHGKKAARHIDAWLRGKPVQTSAKHPIVDFALLNLPIYADAPRSVQTETEADQRISHGFEETTAGLSETEARYEARRCLSCGNCFECDQCYAACPEQAIVKLGPGLRYRYDFDRCTGCAVCYEQCPCHAIEMIPEPAKAAPEQVA